MERDSPTLCVLINQLFIFINKLFNSLKKKNKILFLCSEPFILLQLHAYMVHHTFC